MFSTLMNRIGAMVAILAAFMLIGAGVATAAPGDFQASGKAEAAIENAAVENEDLPQEAQDGQANAAANQAAADEFTSELRLTIVAFLSQLHDFTDCVADNAAAQGDTDTRVEDGFDPKDGCDRPELVTPNPTDFGFGNDESGASDEAGPPADAGRPSHAGPPSDRP